jgi:hypothetical protein
VVSIFDDHEYVLDMKDAILKKNALIFEGRRDKPNLYLKES